MKLKIIIVGQKVHDVGYRVLLLKNAMNLAIPGLSVYNWNEGGQQQVIALIEGDEARIAAFKQIITGNTPELAEVSRVDFEPYDGDIGKTSEMAMFCSFVQLDKAIPLLLRMDNRLESMDSKLESMDNKLESMDDKLGSVDSKIDSMIDIQTDTLDEIHGLRDDLVGSKEWQRRIEKDISVIKSKLGIR